MRNFGAGLMILGGIAALISFAMDTTVYSSGTLIGGEYVGGGSTHNLGLMQRQMMVLHTGLAAFIAGAVMFGISSLGLNNETAVHQQAFNERADETDYEREIREDGVRKFHQIMTGFMVVLFGAIIFLFREQIF